MRPACVQQDRGERRAQAKGRARCPASDPYLQAEFFSLFLLAIEDSHPLEDLQGLRRLSRQDHPAYGLWYPPGGQNQTTGAHPTREAPFEKSEERQGPEHRGWGPRTPSCLTSDFTELKLGQALQLGCIPVLPSSPSKRAFPLPSTGAACYGWASSLARSLGPLAKGGRAWGRDGVLDGDWAAGGSCMSTPQPSLGCIPGPG